MTSYQQDQLRVGCIKLHYNPYRVLDVLGIIKPSASVFINPQTAPARHYHRTETNEPISIYVIYIAVVLLKKDINISDTISIDQICSKI